MEKLLVISTLVFLFAACSEDPSSNSSENLDDSGSYDNSAYCHDKYGITEEDSWTTDLSDSSYVVDGLCDYMSKYMSEMFAFFARCVSSSFTESDNRVKMEISTESGTKHIWTDISGCKHRIGSAGDFENWVSGLSDWTFDDCICKEENGNTYYLKKSPRKEEKSSSSSTVSSESSTQVSSSSKKTAPAVQSSSAMSSSSEAQKDSSETDYSFIKEQCTRKTANLKVSYDGTYYECEYWYLNWTKVDEDSLLPPEKEGKICKEDLFNTMEVYDKDFYVCDTINAWRLLKSIESAPYRYKDSLGNCDTISNKVLHWNEADSAFFGCTNVDGVEEWKQVIVEPYPTYLLPVSFDREKIAGQSLGDSLYKVTIDGIEYRFYSKIRGSQYYFFLTNVVIDDVDYAASTRGRQIFLHGELGNDTILLNSIQNKSSSFDDFYAGWTERISQDCRCGGKTVEVNDSLVSVVRYKESVYMDYETAKTSCPRGYRLPDTTEFKSFLKYRTSYAQYRNDAPIIWMFGLDRVASCSPHYEIYADVFWTSAEKDSGTQYCFETAMNGVTMDEKASRIVECPKDLYPMVQTLCIQE